MPPIDYKTRQAAQFLGVHENTVRLWCAQFAAHLSPGANPPKGSTRILTADDLALLALVRDGRTASKGLQELDIELAQLPAADIPAAGAIVDAPEATGRNESALAVGQRLDSLPAAIVAQLSPVLAAEFERGRELGRAEGRRKVPPEYVLLAVIVAMAAMVIIATIINR